MQEININIPDAGELAPVYVKGRSVIVVEVDIYTYVTEAPKIYLGNTDVPGVHVFPASVYSQPRSVEKQFHRFFIEGTNESGHDDLRVIVTDWHLPPEIKPIARIDPLIRFDVTNNSTRLAASDVAQSFGNSIKYQDGTVTGRKAKYIKLSVEGNDLRCGTSVDQATNVGHVWEVGYKTILDNWYEILFFEYVNAVGAANGHLQVEPFY